MSDHSEWWGISQITESHMRRWLLWCSRMTCPVLRVAYHTYTHFLCTLIQTGVALSLCTTFVCFVSWSHTAIWLCLCVFLDRSIFRCCSLSCNTTQPEASFSIAENNYRMTCHQFGLLKTIADSSQPCSDTFPTNAGCWVYLLTHVLQHPATWINAGKASKLDWNWV